MDCSVCGGKLRKASDAAGSGSGCIIILIGLLLAPVCIGIPVLFYGMHQMGKRTYLWQCRACGAFYPRIRHWWELS